MTALFCSPLSFTLAAGSTPNAATNSPVANLASDVPSYVWKSSNLTTVQFTIDLGAGTLSYDTFALVGSNLRSTDTVQIRTASSVANTTASPAYNSTAFAAHSQTVPTGCTAKTLFRFPTARTERYVRVDIVSTSNPDTFVTAQRLVIGTALTTAGLTADAERYFVDQSIQYTGNGWSSFDVYPKLNGWKVTAAWITTANARSLWHPMLMDRGRSQPLLFCSSIEDAQWVSDVIYGRIETEKTTMKYQFTDSWNLDLQITALAS
jgi:hypothetical protein